MRPTKPRRAKKIDRRNPVDIVGTSEWFAMKQAEAKAARIPREWETPGPNGEDGMKLFLKKCLRKKPPAKGDDNDRKP